MKKIGIIGFGVVGQATYCSIKDYLKEEVHIYDPFKGFDDIKKLSDCDAIFSCLPTPTIHGRQDLTVLEEVIDSLNKIGFSGVLIVKSTTVFHDHLIDNAKFPIVFNPEFLNQNNAIDDFKNQKTIILGGDAVSCNLVKKIYVEFFNFNHSVIEVIYCTHKEACEVKYVHNIYHAYKVLFWHYVQEVTGNERKIFDMYSAVAGHTRATEKAQIYADGKAGFGGACFPKDVVAYNNYHPHTLTEFMVDYNTKLRPDEMRDVL